jgi:hypothetical protein
MKARYYYNLLPAAFLLAGYASAQAPFTSGSTGSDGALNFTTAGTYNFDPTTSACVPVISGCNTPPLDPSGDNIFNFTTINIGTGVTLNLTNTLLRGKPVIWLASGAVTIAGVVNLNGTAGVNLATYGADWITQRVPTQGGPGGFPGGVGARPASPALPGLGPGGAPVQTNASCGSGGAGSFATVGNSTPAGQTYGNTQLVPLIGGSGGSGGCVASTDTATDASGGSGGGGGGAIRIESTTSIALTGQISAIGGSGGVGRSGGTPGGGGSGGAINLIAPSITGGGQLYAYGGGSGGAGYVSLNAASNTYTGTDSAGGVTPTIRPLVAPPLPTFTSVPTVTINSVNGVTVPQPPTGAFQTPDVTINAATAVTINISAVGVPVGTVVLLNVQSELGPDQNISCNPLAGTLASSTATCSASFPTSVSRILASASW